MITVNSANTRQPHTTTSPTMLLEMTVSHKGMSACEEQIRALSDQEDFKRPWCLSFLPRWATWKSLAMEDMQKLPDTEACPSAILPLTVAGKIISSVGYWLSSQSAGCARRLGRAFCAETQQGRPWMWEPGKFFLVSRTVFETSSLPVSHCLAMDMGLLWPYMIFSKQ